MSKKNTEREDETLPEEKRSSLLLFLLFSGLAVCVISIFMMIFSLYAESVNVQSAKMAFAGFLVSAVMIALAVLLREKEMRRIAEANRKKALKKLSVGVAHDFNNLLACFETYATFLSEDLDDSSKQHGFSKRILEANGRAKELVTKILHNPEAYEEKE